jgi:exodeoxyribonuclease V alpha subunit
MGTYTEHAVYGQQFLIESYDTKQPEDLFSVERYLSSGAIKGIGAALAGRIVKKFKEDTFRIIEEEPERLAEVKGISERMAKDIYQQFEEKREMRSAMLFLQQYNITGNLAVKIFTEYGQRMYEILKENPYRLAEDISGVGFKTADEIARRMGIGNDSDYRIKAGILYVLLQASGEGHVYLPELELIQRAKAMLYTDEEAINRQLITLNLEKKIILKEDGQDKLIYSSVYYYMELNAARMLHDLNIRYEVNPDNVRKRVAVIEKQFEIELEEQQRIAVTEAAGNGLLIITGGPGTGKTTIINTIIKFFESEGMDILLAAPTGRAAKRMTETTGYEAKTIHRLLEHSKLSEDQENKFSFERNESNPLETDVLIIDEMSMVTSA